MSKSKDPFVSPLPLAEEARKEHSFYYFFFSKNYTFPANHTDWEAEVKKDLENCSDKLNSLFKASINSKGEEVQWYSGTPDKQGFCILSLFEGPYNIFFKNLPLWSEISLG